MELYVVLIEVWELDLFFLGINVNWLWGYDFLLLLLIDDIFFFGLLLLVSCVIVCLDCCFGFLLYDFIVNRIGFCFKMCLVLIIGMDEELVVFCEFLGIFDVIKLIFEWGDDEFDNEISCIVLLIFDWEWFLVLCVMRFD